MNEQPSSLLANSDQELLHSGLLAIAQAITGPAAGQTFSGALAYKSAVQSIAASTHVALTWDQESYDTDAFHDNTTNNSRFTIPVTGYYLIQLHADWATAAANTRYMHVRKNGVTTDRYASQSHNHAGSVQRVSTSCILYLQAAEYVEGFVWHDGGAATNIAADSAGTCRMSVSRIGL